MPVVQLGAVTSRRSQIGLRQLPAVNEAGKGVDNAKVGRVVQCEFHALSEEHRAEILTLRRQFHRLMVDALEAGSTTGDFSVLDLDGTARALLSMCIDLVRWFDPALSRHPTSVARLNADLALRIAGVVPDPRTSDMEGTAP